MKKTFGFTLIELILYLALVSIFLTGAISFAWDIIYGREKALAIQSVEQSGRLALARIGYEISRAQDINSLTASSLILETGVNDTIIDLNNGVIELTADGVGPLALTSNQVVVDELSFINFSSLDSQTKNIQVRLGLSRAGAESIVMSGFTLNSQFNQARQLLIDASTISLSPNGRELSGITLENTGSSDIVIIQANLAWTGPLGSGSTTNDLNLTILANGELVNLNSLNFDSNVNNALIDCQFILADGSVSQVSLNPSAIIPDSSPSPSPSFSPLPSPSQSPTTCQSICQLNNFSSGICRKNTGACNSSGETRVSAGDIYCVGGANADTCCCAP